MRRGREICRSNRLELQILESIELQEGCCPAWLAGLDKDCRNPGHFIVFFGPEWFAFVFG